MRIFCRAAAPPAAGLHCMATIGARNSDKRPVLSRLEKGGDERQRFLRAGIALKFLNRQRHLPLT